MYYHTLCIFCLQNATEDNIKKVLLDQQKQRQNETTRAISFHIASDFDSIIARLALIANSISGNLSGDVIQKILNEQYPEVGSTIAYPAQFVLINRNGIVVASQSTRGAVASKRKPDGPRVPGTARTIEKAYCFSPVSK